MLENAILFARDSGPPFPFLAEALQTCGINATSVNCEAELLSFMDRFSPECLVVLSNSAQQEEVLQLARQVRGFDHHCSLVVIADSVTTDFAIRAMRAGVSDILDRNAAWAQLLGTITSLVACHRDCRTCHPDNTDFSPCRKLVGSSAAMDRVRDQVLKVAAANGIRYER